MKDLFNFETNQVETLDPDTAQKAVLAGSHGFKKGEKLDVFDPSGEPGKIDAENAQEAFSKGYVLIPPAQLKEIENQEKYGTDTSTEIRAMAESALSAGTLGLSDLAMEAVGVDEEGLRERRERNPIASTIGSLGGIVASTIATGGASVLAKGAQAGTAGAKLAFGAGKAAEGLAKNALASSAIKQGTKQIIEKAAGGLAEGAVFGAGNLISRASLGQEDINAESILSHVGVGAVLDGSISGALKLGGLTASQIGKQAKRALEENKRLTGFIDKIVNDNEVALTGEASKKITNAEIYQAAKELQVDLTEGMQAGSTLGKRISSTLEDSPTWVGAAERSALNKARGQVQKNINEVTQGIIDEGNYAVGRTTKEILTQKIDEAFDLPNKFYGEIDKSIDPNLPLDKITLERMTERLLNRARRKLPVKSPLFAEVNEIADQIKSQPTLSKLKKQKKIISDQLRELTDSRSSKFVGWGDQRTQLLSDALDSVEDTIERTYLTGYQKLKKQGIDVMDAQAASRDALKLYKDAKKSYRDAITVTQDMVDAIGINRVRGGQETMKTILNDLEPEDIARGMMNMSVDSQKWIQQNTPEIWSIVKGIELNKLAKKRVMTAGGEEIIDPVSFVKEVKKRDPAEIALIFGEDGARKIKNLSLIIGANPKKFNPSETATKLEFSNMIKSTLRDLGLVAIRSGGRALKSEQYKTAKGLSKSMEMTDLERTAKALEKEGKSIGTTLKSFVDRMVTGKTPALTTQAVLQNKESNRDNFKEYEKAKAELDKYGGDLSAMIDRTRENLSGVYGVDPMLGEKVQAKAIEALNKIQEMMPKDPNQSPINFRKDKWKPSDTEKEITQRFLRAIDDPKTVFEDLANGHVNREGVEVLKTVYPNMYQAAQVYLVDRMEEIQEHADYDSQVQLSVFFDVALNEFMQPEFIMSLQKNNGLIMQATQQQNNRNLQGNAVELKRPFSNKIAGSYMSLGQKVQTT